MYVTRGDSRSQTSSWRQKDGSVRVEMQAVQQVVVGDTLVGISWSCSHQRTDPLPVQTHTILPAPGVRPSPLGALQVAWEKVPRGSVTRELGPGGLWGCTRLFLLWYRVRQQAPAERSGRRGGDSLGRLVECNLSLHP